jgi:hypothetical protein
VVNSSAFGYLVAVQLGSVGTQLAQSFEVGLIQNTPTPTLEGCELHKLAQLAQRSWSTARRLDEHRETAHPFLVPRLAASESQALRLRASSVVEEIERTIAASALLEAEINERVLAAYGIAHDELNMTSDQAPSHTEVGQGAPSRATTDVGDADVIALTADLLSWCVGIAFGRFDIRLATGEREVPSEPDPFDPLPVCSPGMLTGEDGLPLEAPPVGYAIAWPTDGILVDDPGHPRDLTAAVREVFDVVFGVEADAFWTEASELVDPKGQDIRRWLQKTYFSGHIKRYSKSRRKAPIYWQLATPSASYSIWLYAHRVGRDSLYQVLNDFVSPKLQAEERKLHALVHEHGPNPTAAQRKELDAQESFVSELRVLRDEVARVAPLWNPDLNDGVVIVTAPLYRLVPQLKSWQKELKSHWDALCKGKYDWAQLAMHLWPERVVPKCAEDRSLAIAHDLEEVFWDQDTDGKWTVREEPTRPTAELMTERSSAAVKDALESLLTAPQLSTGRTRTVAA